MMLDRTAASLCETMSSRLFVRVEYKSLECVLEHCLSYSYDCWLLLLIVFVGWGMVVIFFFSFETQRCWHSCCWGSYFFKIDWRREIGFWGTQVTTTTRVFSLVFA